MDPEDDFDPSQGAGIIGPRQPWDRLPSESQKAFDAFVRYRDSEKRSFKNIAEQLNCSPQNVFQWSSRFNWRGRCDAYDLEQDRQQRKELARARVRMRERHVRIAIAMQSIASYAIREWQQRIELGLPLDLAPEQIALLTKCSTELERSAIGVDPEHQHTAINVLIGAHRWPDEKDHESEGEPRPLKEFDAAQYQALDANERAALDRWRDPPKKKLLN